MSALAIQSVVPAVIPSSFEHLVDVLTAISPFSHDVQIDIVDGVFVPFTSWPYMGNGSLQLLRQYRETFTIEADLMLMHPERVIDAYLDAGVQSIVVHLESTNALQDILTHRATHPYRLGLSLRNDTPLDALFPYLSDIDYIQLMGIKDIGSQGQPFDTRVLDRIKELKSRAPDLLVSIDGSVNEETIGALHAAGAERFVSGSAILGAPDPLAAYNALSLLVQ